MLEFSRCGGAARQPQRTEPCQCVSNQPWVYHGPLQAQMKPPLQCAGGVVAVLKTHGCVGETDGTGARAGVKTPAVGRACSPAVFLPEAATYPPVTVTSRTKSIFWGAEVEVEVGQFKF